MGFYAVQSLNALSFSTLLLLTGLGRSLFDYQSANVRQHQEDWAPLLRGLYKAR